jgi:hypothetical protein
MRATVFTLCLVALQVATAPDVAAQVVGFVNGGWNTDLNDSRYPSAGGGAVLDLPAAWVSIGGQGDMLTSFPYVAGRVGVFAQGNLTRRRRIRPFGLAGVGWGEQGGPMVGLGLEVWGSRKFGLRVSLEDHLRRLGGVDCAIFGTNLTQAECDRYFNGGRPRTAHQWSAKIGVAWR